jgi:hypothetical protein
LYLDHFFIISSGCAAHPLLHRVVQAQRWFLTAVVAMQSHLQVIHPLQKHCTHCTHGDSDRPRWHLFILFYLFFWYKFHYIHFLCAVSLQSLSSCRKGQFVALAHLLLSCRGMWFTHWSSAAVLSCCRSAASSCMRACTSCSWMAQNWTQQQQPCSLMLLLLLLLQQQALRTRVTLVLLVLPLLPTQVHCSSALLLAHPMQRLTSTQQVGCLQGSAVPKQHQTKC